MKCRDEKIEIITNGKTTDTFHLNRGYQRGLVYLENEDIAAELAQGKTKKQAKIDYLSRAAATYHNGMTKAIKEIATLDKEAADGLIAELYQTLSGVIETQAGAAVKTETLERMAAVHWFAYADNLYSVMQRDMEESDLLQEVCAYVQEMRDGNSIPVNRRPREARRIMRAIKAEAETEAARELSPAGRAIFDRLSALDAELDSLDLDMTDKDDAGEHDRRCNEAYDAFDAFALEDPEEATRIYRRSPFFDEHIGKYEICLSIDTRCTRLELKRLDTPEKRADYIKTGHFPEDYTGARPPEVYPVKQ